MASRLRITRLIAVLSTVAAGFGAIAAEPTVDAISPVLQQHCVKCHGKDGKTKGKVDLRPLATTGGEASPELLTRILKAVKDRNMPPEDEPPLAEAVQQRLVTTLEGVLEESIRTRAVPPRTPVRRMNRFQYANAVEDLLELKVELFALPERVVREYGDYFQPASGKMPDTLQAGNRPLGKSQLIAPRLNGVAPFPQDLRAEHGYDTRGDLLTLSPLLMESFLTLSRSIVDSPDFGPKTCGQWRALFAAPPAQEKPEDALRERTRRFLTRAFRRPAEAAVLERYVVHGQARLRAGTNFTECMKDVVAAALVSPRFLYLYDGATTGDKPALVDDYELASRLSFFLWGSLPDEALLAVAAAGTLRDPATFAAQADRLMNDRRMKRFCDSFAGQWLKIEHAVASEPQKKLYPDFYFDIRGTSQMMLEPLLIFETVFIENRSILDFIHSDFTYRSDALARFYRREPQPLPWTKYVMPQKFHRVPVTSKREGGVITSAAVMTMTSNSTRTQPITRGAWLVGVIFNDPPPPPPADVPPLDENSRDAGSKNLTLRQKLALHQERADCAACHAKIDPYGFALENYDAVGRWRDTYEQGQPIDCGGKLFNQQAFSNIEEFKDGLLAEKDRFAHAFAAHLLAYALGREVKPVDQPALNRIVRTTAADGYRLRTLMREIACSEPFQSKFNPITASAR
jgi:cytochrome c553